MPHGMLAVAVVAGVLGAVAIFRPAPPPQPIAPAPQPITLTFAGDVMLAGAVGKLAETHGTPWLFAGVQSVFAEDDLTMVNLECAVSTRGQAEEKQYTFRAAPSVLPGLKQSGVEAVTLANNHAMDFGRQALSDTFTNLRNADITYVGAGANADEAYQPALLMVKGQRVALFGGSRVLPDTRWYAGTQHAGLAAVYDPTRLLAEIRAVRAQADLVVVYLHWGIERAAWPEAYQRTLARQCIDAGADLIIGSHPHVLQGFEYYQGKLIAYSLGNFVFNNRSGHTMLVQATFTGNTLQAAKMIPCVYDHYRPIVAEQSAARQRIFSQIQAHSYAVTIGEDGALHERQ